MTRQCAIDNQITIARRRRSGDGTKPTRLSTDDTFSLSEAVPPPSPTTASPRSRRASVESQPNDDTSAALLQQCEAVNQTTPQSEPPRRRRSSRESIPTPKTSDGTYSNNGEATGLSAPLRAAPRRRRSSQPPHPIEVSSDGISLDGQSTCYTHSSSAVPDADQAAILPATAQTPDAAWSSIGIYAAAVDDIERTRIALKQRALAFIRDGAPKEHADVLLMLALSTELEKTEAKAIKRLEWGMMNETPIGAWAKATKGLGLKGVGRFIGCVGDPTRRPLRGDPDHETEKRPIIGWADRTVSQLWAYCGLDVRDGKAPRRAKGVKGNWNAVAKKRAFCMAEPCIKCVSSPYRAVYDAARLKYAEADITKGHQHNRAMRAVMKEIVKDIWKESHRGRASIGAPPITVSSALGSGAA